MGAGGIHANEVVVAIQRDPAAGAADGVAIGRGHAPGDPLCGGQSAPAAGNSTKVAAILLLVRRLRIARGDILTHELAVAAVDVNYRAHAARLWGRDYLAHINCQAGILRPWITPPAIGRVLSQGGTEPGYAANTTTSGGPVQIPARTSNAPVKTAKRLSQIFVEGPVEELAAVVAVEAGHGEGHLGFEFLDLGEDGVAALVPDGAVLASTR